MLLLGTTVADPDLGSASAQSDLAAAAAIARGCIRMHLDPLVSEVGLPPDAGVHSDHKVSVSCHSYCSHSINGLIWLGSVCRLGGQRTHRIENPL